MVELEIGVVVERNTSSWSSLQQGWFWVTSPFFFFYGGGRLGWPPRLFPGRSENEGVLPCTVLVCCGLRAVAQPCKTSRTTRFFSCLNPEVAAVPPACSPRPRASSGSWAPKLASRAAGSRVLSAGVRADRFVGCNAPVAGGSMRRRRGSGDGRCRVEHEQGLD
jgi:hypothetical protein